jgi:hypothetical protein
MMQVEIKDDLYCIQYDPTTAIVRFEGTLLLNGAEEYGAIAQLLNQAIAEQSSITINLHQLKMLNSSGFQMLSRFVMKLRQQEEKQLTIQGNSRISWQGRSLKNLQRLMPAIQIEL